MSAYQISIPYVMYKYIKFSNITEPGHNYKIYILYNIKVLIQLI